MADPEEDAATSGIIAEPPAMHVSLPEPPALEVVPPALEDLTEDITRRPVTAGVAELGAAAVLESVAGRLRRGEILLAAGSSFDSEAVAVAAVLSSLLEANP
jgi:hypothetical protein